MPPNVAVAIELSDQERLRLEAWTRRRTSAQALALRSRIVLLAAEGLKNTEIAERLGVNRAMAAKWRSRFAEYRLDGLTDEPRPGRPRTITDELVDAVDGQRGRSDADGGVADLEGVRVAAASPGDLQALQGPAVRREGPRRRRPVSQPARARRRALRRREVPDSGPGPHRADPADAPRHARARHPRLSPRRHVKPLRRAGFDHREGDRPPAQPPP